MLRNVFQATAVCLRAFQNVLLVLGWNSMSILDMYDGYELGVHSLPRAPLLPPVIGDFNGDGLHDVIVTTSKQ